VTAVSEREQQSPAPGPGRQWWRRRVQPLLLNPLLVRDARSLLRGRRPYLLQTGYLVLLIVAMGLAAFFVRQDRLQRAAFGGGPGTHYGEMMFYAMFETQAVLLFLILIAYSAGAIALEYEKRTFEMVSVTTLSSLEIVLGKVASVTVLCFMLLATSTPLAAVCLLLGGLSPGQIALSYALLAYAIIALASAGVLFSVVAGRTISAFVVSFLCIGGWAVLTFVLSGSDPSTPNLGLLSPLLAPFAGDSSLGGLDDFRLFAHRLPAWITPLVLHGLLAALCIVAAAEALPLHRPRRSTLLRSLLLAFVFFACFLYSAASLERGRLSGTVPPAAPAWQASSAGALFGHSLWESIRGWLALAWLCACLTVPIFSSYLIPRAGERPPLTRWLLAPVPAWRWLHRDTNVGWRATLVFFATIGLGGVLPSVIVNVTGLTRGYLFTPGTVGLLVYAVVLLAVSLFGYSAWGTAMSAAWRDRRVGAMCTVMIIMALNVIGVYYLANVDGFRRLPFLAHPVVALTSPLPAALTAINPSSGPRYFAEAWSSPIYVIGVAFIYQALVVAGAFHVLRMLDQKGQSEPAAAPAVEAAVENA
jgi:ABC-type transport system involved in multi-copper enzyme maturation permease subunit